MFGVKGFSEPEVLEGNNPLQALDVRALLRVNRKWRHIATDYFYSSLELLYQYPAPQVFLEMRPDVCVAGAFIMYLYLSVGLSKSCRSLKIIKTGTHFTWKNGNQCALVAGPDHWNFYKTKKVSGFVPSYRVTVSSTFINSIIYKLNSKRDFERLILRPLLDNEELIFKFLDQVNALENDEPERNSVSENLFAKGKALYTFFGNAGSVLPAKN